VIGSSTSRCLCHDRLLDLPSSLSFHGTKRDVSANFAQWRKDVKIEWGITVDAPDDHHAFCMFVLNVLARTKPSDVEYFLRKQARHEKYAGGPRKIFCRIFGCRPVGPCHWSPHCTNCEGRCPHCFNYVVPSAKIERA
jgi:hypothetical protein